MDVVSPAMCEGESDYDFAAYAKQFMQKMANVKRRSAISGVCFMVHRRVFDSGGLFDDDVRLGGYEDDEFFRRSRQAGFRLAMTGRSFIHHFGSVTQQAIKASQNLPTNARIGDRAYYRRKYGLTWFKRKRWKFQEKIQSALHRISERSRYHCTLRSRRKDGVLTWG
jgi:GT2 family glycosyltransferase